MNIFKATMTAEQRDRMTALCAGDAELLTIAQEAKEFTPSTEEQREAARVTHTTNECEVDDDAGISDPGDGTGYWVQAWVWVETPEDEDTND